MKTKTILYFLIISLLVSTFFFSFIPSPVENIRGIENPNNYVYGGVYWTSGLYQLSVGNYLGVLAYLGIFITLSGGVYLWR